MNARIGSMIAKKALAGDGDMRNSGSRAAAARLGEQSRP
jgi:hypothetical protein